MLVLACFSHGGLPERNRSDRFCLCRLMLTCVALWLGLVPVRGLAQTAEPPQVVVSSRPLHSLVAGIMQRVGEPTLLIDSPNPPWDYTPGEVDTRLLDEADLIIWTGRELEPGLADVLDRGDFEATVLEVLASPDLKVLPARHDERLRDPFYWLDSRNMLILLETLARSLVDRDPGRANDYEFNWRQMLARVLEVDRSLEFGYREVSGAPVFFFHDTHQYFQQAYAMQVAGSVMPAGVGRVPDAARLLEIRAQMLRTPGACLFTEKGLDEPHLELILTDTQVRRVELDSLGVGLSPGPELYVQLMRDNFARISACIGEAKPAVTAAPRDPLAPDERNFPDRITPRYLMQDQFGRTVTNEDFAGRYQLINFGYTYCPDVCPTSLAVMSQAMRLLGDDAEQVQPIFITVDPERDKPEVLREYLAYFDERLLGLSASPAVTKRTAELFRARYERVPAAEGDPRRYTMDHTASVCLLGPRGEFLTKFAYGLTAREVAARIGDYLGD